MWKLLVCSCAHSFIKLALVLIVIGYLSVREGWVLPNLLGPYLNALCQPTNIIKSLTNEFEFQLLKISIALFHAQSLRLQCFQGYSFVALQDLADFALDAILLLVQNSLLVKNNECGDSAHYQPADGSTNRIKWQLLILFDLELIHNQAHYFQALEFALFALLNLFFGGHLSPSKLNIESVADVKNVAQDYFFRHKRKVCKN